MRDLARRLSETGMLEVLELRTGLSVRSTSFVGRVRLGEIEITVVPKLRVGRPPEAAPLRLRAAEPAPLPSTAHTTQALGFQDILVWQLVEEAQELLARGLRRAYVRREEALASPRGRIDFQAMAGRGSLVEATLPCVHHRRDEDRLINRVLLAGLRLAASVAADRGLRVRAGRLADLLGESVSPIRLDRQVFRRLEGEMDRMTRAYEPAVSLIRILHEAGGLSLGEGEAGPSLPGFLFDMNRFFQALLARYPRRQPPGAHRPLGAPAQGDVRLRARLEPPPAARPRPPARTSWCRRGRRPWRSWMRSTGTSGRTRCPGTCSTSLRSMR